MDSSQIAERDWTTRADAPGKGEPALDPRVERVTGAAACEHRRAWADLAGRSLEPNVFLDPAFALPLLRHVRSARFDVLLVWDAAPAGRLIGLLPLALPGIWRSLSGVVGGFAHEQVALGTPLLDREHGMAAFLAMLGWLRVHADAAALRLTAIAATGAFYEALTTPGAIEVACLDERRRAILLPRNGSTRRPSASARRRKELRRQHRRLSELGRRTYVSARSPDDVARAAGHFLRLENGGWKGGRGTALLADPGLARFARSMTALMARDGKCRIDAVEIDGRAVAMGIVLTLGDRAYFWKTTFDERHASLSPGVQFALDLTEALREEPAVASVDSCAVPEHSMIARLWPDSLALCDLLIAIDPARPRRFRRAVGMERALRRARRVAKALVVGVRRLTGDGH